MIITAPCVAKCSWQRKGWWLNHLNQMVAVYSITTGYVSITFVLKTTIKNLQSFYHDYYSTLCRQVFMTEEGMIAVYNITTGYVSITFTGPDDVNIAIVSTRSFQLMCSLGVNPCSCLWWYWGAAFVILFLCFHCGFKPVNSSWWEMLVSVF